MKVNCRVSKYKLACLLIYSKASVEPWMYQEKLFTQVTDKGKIKQPEVKYVFKNQIADKNINKVCDFINFFKVNIFLDKVK
tara:strand:+ start:195 stop:437 length:243 start_codon:yes stop_codon:yes gene_type:complete